MKIFTLCLMCLTPYAAKTQSVIAVKKFQRLYLCGGPEVREVEISQPTNGIESLRELWRWEPQNSQGMPISMMPLFVSTDDCKPSDDNRQLLVTSSANAVALISRESGATLFYANVIDAHSAEFLPDGLLAVASSSDPGKVGNAVLLFDKNTSDNPLQAVPLLGAHGVAWDAQRRALWALGADVLLKLSFRRSQFNPRLVVAESIPLPQSGGHDLLLDQTRQTLHITTVNRVYTYDPERAEWKPSKMFEGQEQIKSISINPDNGRIAYTQADPGVWWTYTLRLKQPDVQFTQSNMMYKVRWIPDQKQAAKADK